MFCPLVDVFRTGFADCVSHFSTTTGLPECNGVARCSLISSKADFRDVHR
jgi:hypothetical protein